MTTAPVILRAERVGKCYRWFSHPSKRLWSVLTGQPGGQAHWVLRDVSFQLAPGEALGIVGRNGAGKSTLLQIVAGILTPSEGRIERPARCAALLELGAGFHPEFTGRENARLALALAGVPSEALDELTAQAIAFAEIGEAIDQPVRTYSSGMFVRLAFAVATATEPPLLIIDEALSVGDEAFARKSFARIQQLRAGGAAILFVSHVLYQVERFCERALWLDAGRVRLLDASHRVVAQYRADIDRQNGPSASSVSPVAFREKIETASVTAADPIPVGETNPALASESSATPESGQALTRPEIVSATAAWSESEPQPWGSALTVPDEPARRRLELRLTVALPPDVLSVQTGFALKTPDDRVLASGGSHLGAVPDPGTTTSPVTTSGGTSDLALRRLEHRYVLDLAALGNGEYRLDLYLLDATGTVFFEYDRPAWHLTAAAPDVPPGWWRVPFTVTVRTQ